MNTEKWKKAVIHLEGASDSFDVRANVDLQTKAHRDWQSGAITDDEHLRIQQEFGIQIMAGSRDRRSRGTAIFLLYNDKKYLVTARHVLADDLENKRAIQRADPLLYDRIFNIIFRVRSINEVLKDPDAQVPFLMNLNAGVTWAHPFTFSDPQIDLAVVSLNQRGDLTRFADDLLTQGYIPITIDDLGVGPEVEGQDVFTVGYPEATSIIGDLNLHPAMVLWGSNQFSEPTFSFGKVSMKNTNLFFFWADMSIYPGNSGGPVIADDKLIGIVSAQAVVGIDQSSEELKSRIPFGKIINAEHIIALLASQETKDGSIAAFRTPSPPAA